MSFEGWARVFTSALFEFKPEPAVLLFNVHTLQVC